MTPHEEALRRILEIAYPGHPDGRETRLEMIARIALNALAKPLAEGNGQ